MKASAIFFADALMLVIYIKYSENLELLNRIENVDFSHLIKHSEKLKEIAKIGVKND